MTEEQIKRKLLWMPCQSKQDLHRWIKIYLGLDMPDGTVDPASNSSPMDVIWETYRAALDGREDFTQALAYSSRDSFKTLGAAVIELLMIVHCERSAAHMAAIESQAKKSQQYLKKFLNRPLLRDYVTSKNERTLEMTRYRLLKDSATVLTPAEWGALTQAQKDQYEEIKNYISIVICTIAGANCVSPKSLITTHNGQKVADEVVVGEIVQSVDVGTGQIIQQPVLDIVYTRKEQMYLFLWNGAKILLSYDHPLMVKNEGWRQAAEVPIGTEIAVLVDGKLEYVAVCGFSAAGYGTLLDLVMDTDSEDRKNFFANGILVHNSEHVPFMCVDGESLISVKSDSSNRTRVQRTARGIFRRLAGKKAGGRESNERMEISEPVARIEALSLNLSSGQMEFQPILRASKDVRETIRVVAGSQEIVCTDDHPLYVWGKGFVQANEIAIGDRVLHLNRGQTSTAATGIEAEPELSVSLESGDEWDQVVLGSLLGDGGVYKKPQNNPYMSEQHCVEQEGYVRWKMSVLANKVRLRNKVGATSGYTGEPQVGYDTGCSPLFLPYVGFRQTLEGIDRLGPLGLAVWYMDDGCAGNGFRISSESFTKEQNEALAELLSQKFGIPVHVESYSKLDKTYWFLRGGIEAKRRLVEICEPHVHPDMAYKFDLSTNWFNCEKCGTKSWFYQTGSAARTCQRPLCKRIGTSLHLLEVTRIESAGRRAVYDFTVADNHNFFANGLLNKNCVDELDVISNPDAYEESKFIPTITNGKPPITFLTSTRKYSFGIVQKEIDKANDSGLQIRHWNIIDVTERCHPDRHLPDEERVDIYYSEDLLRAVSKPEWELMSPDQQARFVKGEGYAGCLKNCRLFAVCKGRLADRTERPYSDAKYNTDKRIMLKTIPHVITQFRKSSNEKAKAQLMCWKPSKEGLIYPSFDRDVHSLTPAQMAYRITGEHYSPHLTKAQLIDIMQQRQLRFVAGQDYGFTHNFATVTAAVQGANCYVFDVISAPELELHQKIEICEAKLKRFNPEIWADVAYPSDIKSFKRAGFRMRDWAKAKDSVTGGIESVRSKLSPTMGEPQLFFLREDDGCELLMRRISEYHWKLDAANKPTDIPDDTDDDECDALRYLVMNVFSPKPQVAAPTEESVAQKSNWMSDQIKTLVGEDSFDTGGSKGRSGGFVWDL